MVTSENLLLRAFQRLPAYSKRQIMFDVHYKTDSRRMVRSPFLSGKDSET